MCSKSDPAIGTPPGAVGPLTAMNTEVVVPTIEVTTDRLRLRPARATDIEGLVDLQINPLVRAHLGGPRTRHEVERYLLSGGITALAGTPGACVVAARTTDDLIGTVVLDRRSGDLAGHVIAEGGELELSYLLRPDRWGHGFALEAATAALQTAAAALPDQPVLIVTQTANERSLELATRLGFEPITTFTAYGAEQTLAAADLHAFLPRS